MGRQDTIINARLLADFHARLRAWYTQNGRHALPWRNTHDPYRIYLSEIMLQQTQVETVLSRFWEPFLARFPTLHALADTREEDLLKAWQGLGYYTRAANLHRAARQCGGCLPQTVEGLMELPGVGRNTAHAIAAFAHGAPVAVMEANVKRVLCRIFALPRPAEKDLWAKAHALLGANAPFLHNQAMMDVGALVCTPAAPRCDACPASKMCAGKGAPLAYPARRAKKTPPVRKMAIVVRMDTTGRIHAAPRATRFLKGMYGFQERPLAPKPKGERIGAVSHAYSHFRLEADIYLLRTRTQGHGEGWFTLEEFLRLPHSRTEEKILRLL